MADKHSDVSAELWALAETVLTRLEPVLRQAVEDQRQRPQQGCSWCPVCAMAALIRGEQHELLTLVASEGAAVIALLRQLMSEHTGTRDRSDATANEASTTAAPATHPDGGAAHIVDPTIGHATEDPVVRRAKFVPITVTVKDPTTPDAGD